MKKIFLTVILFLFIFSCGTDNTEKTDEKEIKEQNEKKELNFKACLALNSMIKNQLNLVTNSFCNANKNESLETQKKSILEVEKLLKNKELIKKNKILKKYFIEMDKLIKSEEETAFFNFALLKENRTEIKNFIYYYKMLEKSEKLNSGWTWGELFETVKKEYKKLVGKNFLSFKETKINVINFIKSETFKNKKEFCKLRKESEPVVQKINKDELYFVFEKGEFYFLNNLGKTLSDVPESEIANFLCVNQN